MRVSSVNRSTSEGTACSGLPGRHLLGAGLGGTVHAFGRTYRPRHRHAPIGGLPAQRQRSTAGNNDAISGGPHWHRIEGR
jgi:hypothetical protein